MEIGARLTLARMFPCTIGFETQLHKVAVCVRTKDFGRFLPEWIAYHYAIGVDEITIYDDDSVDKTKEVKHAVMLTSPP